MRTELPIAWLTPELTGRHDWINRDAVSCLYPTHSSLRTVDGELHDIPKTHWEDVERVCRSDDDWVLIPRCYCGPGGLYPHPQHVRLRHISNMWFERDVQVEKAVVNLMFANEVSQLVIEDAPTVEQLRQYLNMSSRTPPKYRLVANILAYISLERLRSGGRDAVILKLRGRRPLWTPLEAWASQEKQ